MKRLLLPRPLVLQILFLILSSNIFSQSNCPLVLKEIKSDEVTFTLEGVLNRAKININNSGKSYMTYSIGIPNEQNSGYMISEVNMAYYPSDGNVLLTFRNKKQFFAENAISFNDAIQKAFKKYCEVFDQVKTNVEPDKKKYPFDRSDNRPPLEIEMIFVQGGTFMMGSKDSPYSNEKPAHPVTVGSFYISKYEITQAQWAKLIYKQSITINYPVEASWDMVQKFINKLNLQTGISYRLPTEAEWEFAARGGVKSKGYNWAGSNNVNEVAEYMGNNNYLPAVVGKRMKPNEIGLHDMSGNLWEWCSDWYDSNYYNNSPQNNPQGPLTGTSRVVRGGSSESSDNECRVYYRKSKEPNRYIDIGFRLVVPVDEVLSKRENKETVYTYVQPIINEVKSDLLKLRNSITMSFVPTSQKGSWRTMEFSISKYEITFDQYDLFCEATGREKPDDNGWGRGTRPVINVSEYDAREFADFVGLRLPMTNEWESACNSDFAAPPTHENFNSDRTQPVGSFEPNSLGLYDMQGNVSEWCFNGEFRGGAYLDKPDSKSCPCEKGWTPRDTRFIDTGFRVAGDAALTKGKNITSNEYERFIQQEVWLVKNEKRKIEDEKKKKIEDEKKKIEDEKKKIEDEKKKIEDEKNKIELEVIKKTGIECVYIPAGSFIMGSHKKEEGHESDEAPRHRVTLKGYYMGKYEVTQGQWRAVMGSNPSYTNNCDSCPVERVSWDDVQKFIEKLNQLTGKKYRLPTEAEWEYACRAGTTTPFNTGNNLTTSQANYGYMGKTIPVGSFAANAYGLFDMHGNVWEWCSDWYDNYSRSSQTNPQGPKTGSYRVYRGGSWRDRANDCRSATRNGYTPDYRIGCIGFRLVSPE